ncbi:UPF0280 family protein [Piscinibacter sp.]|uniref:UPF0280 family protein n=1 Tax=Piscinibacter sp. TaxID=1903157 RepID=UPI002B70328F|nr:UPF0280 family protein [Albitalea sp.]HUG21428.1 UPF0280 family protein [Albitalea sp.]
MPAQRKLLPDGRWHFQHGPIDLLIGADGDAPTLAHAQQVAWRRFETILDELVAELPLLRRPVSGCACPLNGDVARNMWVACHPYRAAHITPMAAVAGAVAQAVLACYRREGVTRAWVNNGGDIALHLTPGSSWRVGLFADVSRFEPRTGAGPLRTDADFTVHASLPVRGIATSGWRGRSFSLGIADSVTVLARTAAEADAAATVIANAVNVDDSRIVRRPACEMKDDSDLGTLPVTVDVPTLDDATVRHALAAGERRARDLQALGLIWSAALSCQGRFALVDAERQAQLPQMQGSVPQPCGQAVGSVFA